MTPFKAVVITAAVIFYVINVSLEYVAPKEAENCKPRDSREGKDPINENLWRTSGNGALCYTECMKINQTKSSAWHGTSAPVCYYRTQYERQYNRTDILAGISSDCELKCMRTLPARNQLECLADFCCMADSHTMFFCAGPGEPQIKREECHPMITAGKANFYVGMGLSDMDCKRT